MVYIAKYQKKWLDENPDYMREWRKKHREKILEYHKEWEKQHPGYMSEKVRNSINKKSEYYKEQKREYARKHRQENKIEIGEIDMKFRNRGKHSFKRLKRQTQIYDYVLKRIKNGDSFQVIDIANDLGIARTTCIEILQELQEKTDGELQYSRGCIVIKNVGNNGYGKLAEDTKGLKVKKVSKRHRNRQEKIEQVYAYLCELAKEDKPIPCLNDMQKDFNNMHRTTLGDILRILDKEDKIIYKRGKVLAVNYRDIKSDTGKTLKYVKQDQLEIPVEVEEQNNTITDSSITINCEPITTTINTDVIASSFGMSDVSLTIQEQNYDKAVKKVVADYITNADITTKEDVISYVEALYKITDKVKQELF